MTAVSSFERAKELGHEWWIWYLRSSRDDRNRGPVVFFFTRSSEVGSARLGGGCCFARLTATGRRGGCVTHLNLADVFFVEYLLTSRSDEGAGISGK